MTDTGKFILFPLKVILTSFKSISMMSDNIFLFNSICSGVNFPVILNRCMLPAVLHNLLVYNTEYMI